ncbi:Hypp5965 [Branchiostoma lanceolatum]|uniref:Hypp5965 protein n=1 Tax=Branchiostoma lanceolatum TaxID=7740 RepID=A0A8J9VLL0_BRALA|nr:Hypp5965 [Branchiostoma lanceolatum]
MAFLKLIAVILMVVTFCEGDVPQVGPGSGGPAFREKENNLLRLLLAEKDLKWNGNKVQGVRKVIDDIRRGKDPGAEDPATKMELALAYRDLLKENPFREEQTKKQVENDFPMNYHEKNALKKLEKDVVNGKDPLSESAKIQRRISKDGAKLFRLAPEEQETEKAVLIATYGEKGQDIWDAITVIRKEVQAKVNAETDAEKAMEKDIGSS